MDSSGTADSSPTPNTPDGEPPVPGHVTSGGASLVWNAPSVEIRKAAVSDMQNNVYLLTERASGEKLLIDAADDAPRVLDLVAEPNQDGPVAAVVTTHDHWDHHRALSDVIAATGAPVLAGAQDADGLPLPVDRRLEHGDTVAFGSQQVAVLALRGHTPGSVALAWTEPDSGRVHLFTGDSLFPGGPGKTNSTEDFTSLMDDLQTRVFGVYGDDTVIYPGHGDNTTLGTERPHLDTWQARGW